MPESPGRWSQLSIDGKTADVYEPGASRERCGAVLFLHGHSLETLRDNPAYSAALEKHALPAVCPHGARSWWLDTVCPEFDERITPLAFLRDRITPFIGDRWSAAPPQVALLGIGMGGQGVLQLAYRDARAFPVVAAISPAIDFQNLHGQGLPLDAMFPNREAARQQTATLQLHPLSWPRHQMLVCDPADEMWFEGVERLAMKLSSLGIPYEADFSSSRGGHCWDYFNSVAEPAIGFIANRLQLESRRH